MKRVWGFAMAALFVGTVAAQVERADALPSPKMLNRAFGEHDVEAFRQPPKVFYPETWFHFIGGNVARDGITADLEAIAGAGIQGVQFFHGQFGGPWPGVEPQIKCLSETWDDLLGFVAGECERLGLRFTMQNCPGWAMAGGPWIAPGNAMRHLVWSRSEVAGGKTVELALPQPQPSGEEWRDYRDVAVVAFPMPEGDTGKALVPISVKGNRDNQPWDKCLKGEQGGRVTLEPGAEPTWVEVAFGEPVTLRTVQFPSVQAFNHGWCYLPGVTVSVYAVLPEGEREVAKYAMPSSTWQENTPISLACSDASSAVYRLKIENKHTMAFDSLRLFTVARKNNWESEAAFVLRALMREPEPQQSPAAWIDAARIVELTDKVDERGTLRWEAPAGRWTVLRWGHVNTGKRNGPAPEEATGWECDKLSTRGADAHFAGYIGRVSGKDGPVGGGRLQGMLLDSWECESQTWTEGLDEEFLRRRGYPLRPWLPALAGYVVGDLETTTRFLRDWRTMISDLQSENFFGRISELGRKNKLAVSFETASGDVFPGDILQYYKHADVPMCEFWQPNTEHFVGSLDFKPVKPCASAARLYGKPRVAAEAFTSFALTWNERWEMLKDVANIHFAEGVSHLVFHTYTHNPRIDWLPPGTAFGSGIGTPFLRGQTWWRHMPEFTAYLARCGYLLERGLPVSDVLLYLGDEQDHKPPQTLAEFPDGFKYDYCNPDVLLNRLSVDGGDLVTPEGVRYRVLWLRDCRRMLPETLEKIQGFVRKGVTVVGDAPQGLATLSGGAKAQARFDKAVTALWGPIKGPVDRRVGQGRVIAGVPISDAIARVGLEPDVSGKNVMWSHRRIKGADWYFVASREGFDGTLGFRSRGEVEVWNPVSGTVTGAKRVTREGNRSHVAVTLPSAGACFVVFRHDMKSAASQENPAKEETVRQIPLSDAWSLAFPLGWDAPAQIRVDALKPWSELDMSSEAKAFSGTASYTREFGLDVSSLAGDVRIELDLGRVEMIAAVNVNGEKVGTVWAPPYRLDITRAVKLGTNRLTIEVTSTWFNRLVYDAGLPEAERKTWTISGPSKDAVLQPYGLLGPVTVRVIRN